MRARRRAALAAAVMGALLIGGCAADAGTPADAMDDAALCTAAGDVLTILENADLGLDTGRMAEQERDGWYQLAARVLDRLPSTGESPVRTAIGELQAIAPGVPPGAAGDTSGVRSAAWVDAEDALEAACDDAGAPLAIGVFTGG